MMYSNKLIAVVKSNGKVLREQGENVFLPFGQEFTILIKNKNSLRALIKIEIDGTDATEGTSLIVPANGEVELERFIKNGNLQQGNKFKFIERTAQIEQHRGAKVDDGFIRIEFEFEREAQPIKSQPIYTTPWRPYEEKHFFLNQEVYSQDLHTLRSVSRSGVTGTASLADSQPLMNMAVAQNASYAAQATADSNTAEQALTGITVPGAVSDQKFTVGAWFPTDGVKHVIIMRMFGETAQGVQVTKPVTVKSKPKCTTCGHTNKANAKFCSNCGTSLTLV